MPMFVNMSGVVVCVNDDMVEKAARDGLRPVTEDDMQWAREDRSRFALPRVDGYERGVLGMAPVVAVGCGPSMHTLTPGMTRIQCNPRADSPGADFAIALDGIYWNMSMWAAYRDQHPGVQYYAPRYVHCDHNPPPKAFNMPVRVIRGKQDDYLEIRTQQGIQKAHFTGIASVLFAQYLTNGPVIILGFDLDRCDANGAVYAVRQTPSWKAAAALWTNVFVHPATTGSIRDWFPVWENDYASARTERSRAAAA